MGGMGEEGEWVGKGWRDGVGRRSGAGDAEGRWRWGAGEGKGMGG